MIDSVVLVELVASCYGSRNLPSLFCPRPREASEQPEDISSPRDTSLQDYEVTEDES